MCEKPNDLILHEEVNPLSAPSVLTPCSVVEVILPDKASLLVHTGSVPLSVHPLNLFSPESMLEVSKWNKRWGWWLID